MAKFPAPGMVFVPPPDPTRISHSMTIRVPDCRGAYALLRSRGAPFTTPPRQSPWEVRCFFRDPDGHVFEISERKG